MHKELEELQFEGIGQMFPCFLFFFNGALKLKLLNLQEAD